jgi:predicted transcriptional regulator
MRKKSLTDAEHRLMQTIWERGPSTVADVHAAQPALAYSTVLTTMRILEEKGWLRHTKEGRAFVYHPIVNRDEAGRHAVRDLLDKFFGSRADLLVLNMIENEEISRAELDRLKKLTHKEKR